MIHAAWYALVPRGTFFKTRLGVVPGRAGGSISRSVSRYSALDVDAPGADAISSSVGQVCSPWSSGMLVDVRSSAFADGTERSTSSVSMAVEALLSRAEGAEVICNGPGWNQVVHHLKDRNRRTLSSIKSP
jgi:hypothetical protein